MQTNQHPQEIPEQAVGVPLVPAQIRDASVIQSNRAQHPWVAAIMDELRKPDPKYPHLPAFAPRVRKIVSRETTKEK